MVSTPACHAGDRGSIPRRGDDIYLFIYLFIFFFGGGEVSYFYIYFLVTI